MIFSSRTLPFCCSMRLQGTSSTKCLAVCIKLSGYALSGLTIVMNEGLDSLLFTALLIWTNQGHSLSPWVPDHSVRCVPSNHLKYFKCHKLLHLNHPHAPIYWKIPSASSMQLIYLRSYNVIWYPYDITSMGN